ncbi:MAG: choice-of-anchor D domain-containing protein, partial [Porticoccaceae bacterium]|nr:choice-of-anchor D domain-containing protein [Porticoccaceae bacterium]
GGTGRGVGESGGAGGNGTLGTVNGTSTSGGAVTVTGTATGGTGGAGATGANGGLGGNGDAVNALSGSSTGTLSLTQTGTGGAGGSSDGGGSAGNGGIGNAEATGTNSGGTLTVTATANGGNGGAGFSGSDAGDAGIATLGTALATDTVNGTSSSGSTVNVTGAANGGNGGAASGSGNAGDGASIAMTDKVDGSTSGSLTLTQNISGGNSGAVDSGLNGTAGSAFSSLSKDVTADAIKPSALSVNTQGFGGNGGERDAATGQAANGADGTAISSATNNGGSARVQTDARGGTGGVGRNGADGGDGGNSFSTATASTSGDGNSIDVDGFAAFSSGHGGGVTNGAGSDGGAGGTGTSSSTGIASGNSHVNVRDDADGGTGGTVSSGTGSGGAGGDAISNASGSNAAGAGTAQNVIASANGRGGNGGTGRGVGESGGAGGNGTASATATGIGFTSAVATAAGGTGGTGVSGAVGGLGGSAFATADASGVSGSATSNATGGTSNGFLVNDVNAIASAPVSSSVTTEARAQYTGPGFTINDAAGKSAVALAYAAPTSTVSLPMIAANAVHANFDITGTHNNHTYVDSGQLNSDVYGVAVLGAGSPLDATSGSSRTYTTDINYDVDLSQLQSGEQNLLMGFMNPVITGNIASDPNFQVTLRVRQEGAVIETQTFTTQTALNSYFNGVTHNLSVTDSANTSGDLDLQVELDVRTSNPGVGFAVDTVFGNSTETARAASFVNNTVINTGEMHIGDTVLAGVSVSNLSVAGSDGANAQFTATTGQVNTNGGIISGLAPQTTDNSTLQVSVDSSSSGVRTGTANVELATDGAVTGNAEIFANVNVQVSGTVYELASAQINNGQPIAFGNVHVGDIPVAQDVSITNTALNNGFGENLNASAGAVTGGVISNGGLFNGLAAQGTDVGSINVNIDTSSAGNKAGLATIDFVSDGNGINNLGQTPLASQDVAVTGQVFRLATATVDNPLAFAFGNVHVGDSASQAVSLTNSATADAFSESLNASFGSASDARIQNNGGSVGQLAAGDTDNSAMVVTVDTSAAGNVSGTQTLNFASDGTGTSGLGITGLPSQDLNVSASITAGVYRLANPLVNNAQPLAFGNFREGDVVTSQALSITNNVPNDGFSESLNGSVGGTSGGVTTNGGSFNLLAAAGTDNSAISVAIDTSTAGDKAGNATLDFVSDGTGTSGLGQTPLASQDVAVTGQVFRLAQMDASPSPVVFADSHVGDTASQGLSIANTATNDGFSEQLSVTGRTDAGDVTSSGMIGGLINAGTSDTGVSVALDTSSAGAKSGSVTFSGESDGTNTSGFTTNVSLTDRTVNVSGNVYRLAEASAHSPEPVVLGNVHVGDLSQAALTISNTAATDGFSENLNASLGSTTGDATASGSFSGLAASGSDSSSLVVGIDTSTAGAKTGTAALGLESDGDGINSLGQTALAGQTVNISGNVYRLAEATVDNPLAFAFGNVHVGDSASQAVSLTNSATADAFSESLNASFGSASDARIQNNGGSVGQLAAGDTDNSAMVVTVDTSAAGNVSGTQTLNFASDGTGTSGLGITGLPSQDLNVSASITAGVYRLANPLVNNAQPLAFGNFREGDVVTSQALSITNNVPNDGFSESLNGSVGGTSGGVTTNGGSFNLLAAAGTDNSAISVAIDTSTAGDKAGNATLDFVSDGTGTSGLGQTPLASQDVAVTGQVFRLAQMDASPSPVVFADSHVGDTASQGLSIANTATNDGFSEQLSVTGRTDAGDVTSSGMIGGLINAGTSDTGVSVALDTSSAGAKSGSVTFSGESDGTNTSGFTTNVSLADQVVNVVGNVYT